VLLTTDFSELGLLLLLIASLRLLPALKLAHAATLLYMIPSFFLRQIYASLLLIRLGLLSAPWEIRSLSVAAYFIWW
jgi:hypothetical protein